jgi:hypothetical protein
MPRQAQSCYIVALKLLISPQIPERPNDGSLFDRSSEADDRWTDSGISGEGGGKRNIS